MVSSIYIGGNAQIWAALQNISTEQDYGNKQAILDSLNVTLPTGDLRDGCYDRLLLLI